MAAGASDWSGSDWTSSDWISPDWPAPAQVKAWVTTRRGGVSQPPYDSFNVGDHVADDPQAVAANRALLQQRLLEQTAGAEVQCQWLQQVHGIDVAEAGKSTGVVTADAAFSRQLNQACVVMTADCLPVLFCDQDGTQVAAAHAGWRGLQSGVLEQTLAAFNSKPQHIMAWLGPAIGPQAFEVGAEVRAAFCAVDPAASHAFKAQAGGKYLADIYLLARQRLEAQGVTAIYGGDFCTVTDASRFFSYRRDGVTGRMASLVWLQSKA